MKSQTTAKADDRGRVTLGAEYANRHVTLTTERKVDLTEVPVMRAVHFLDASSHGRGLLYAGVEREDAEALIGIDWNTGPVWARGTFSDHKNGRAIEDYNAMEKASEGALVSAYYGRRKENMDGQEDVHLDDSVILGLVPSGSVVKPIPVENAAGDGSTFVKTLPLVDTVEVTRGEHPGLFEDFAQGRSVYNTPAKEDLIRSVYEDRFY